MKVKRIKGEIGPERGFSYNRSVGRWWMSRAGDGPHQRAYVNIANFIRHSISRDPSFIVDYACGTGNLLSLLCRRFPGSRLAGLDGSSLLLDRAEHRLSRLQPDCARRITLIETSLPGRVSLGRRADLVVFCFPNMMPSRSEEKVIGPEFLLSRSDREIAKKISRARDSLYEDHDARSPQMTRHTLEYARSISQNLRGLMTRGGICVRAEYATTRRHEWSAPELLRVSFEEGSLDTTVNGTQSRPWFRVLASAYFRSRVLEDVFQQTGDARDTGGGYLITVLRAI